MNINFKRTFFSNLMVVLIVVSNLVGVKFTNFNGLILSVNFLLFPFIYLCFLLINNYCNKKEAFASLLSGVLIQVFILLVYVLIAKLGSQNLIPDLANYVNVVFKPSLVYIIANLISLLASCYVLHYVYEYFRIIGYKLLGTVISILIAIILYGLISIPAINFGFGIDIIIDIIMGHLMMSVIMTIVVAILYYILKDKEYPYYENNVFIKEVKLETLKNRKDKPIEEVIKIGEEKKHNVVNDKSKKVNNKANTIKKSTKTSLKSQNNTKNSRKKDNDSKKTVKK